MALPLCFAAFCLDHGRRLFQRQKEGRLGECANKRLRFREERRKLRVAASAKCFPFNIGEIITQEAIRGQVSSSLLIELVFVADGPGCFIFEFEGTDSDLQRLLEVKTVYACDHHGNDVPVVFTESPGGGGRTGRGSVVPRPAGLVLRHVNEHQAKQEWHECLSILSSCFNSFCLQCLTPRIGVTMLCSSESSPPFAALPGSKKGAGKSVTKETCTQAPSKGSGKRCLAASAAGSGQRLCPCGMHPAAELLLLLAQEAPVHGHGLQVAVVSRSRQVSAEDASKQSRGDGCVGTSRTGAM